MILICFQKNQVRIVYMPNFKIVHDSLSTSLLDVEITRINMFFMV